MMVVLLLLVMIRENWLMQTRACPLPPRPQMMMPLAQGVLYNLALAGWGFWNRNAQYSGSSAGARLRRWWYEVNHWPIPTKTKKA